jgi:hypothetical protein
MLTHKSIPAIANVWALRLFTYSSQLQRTHLLKQLTTAEMACSTVAERPAQNPAYACVLLCLLHQQQAVLQAAAGAA